MYIHTYTYKILRLASHRLQILDLGPCAGITWKSFQRVEACRHSLRLGPQRIQYIHYTRASPTHVYSTLGISCTISPLGPPPSAAALWSLFLITLYPPASAAGAFRKSQELKKLIAVQGMTLGCTVKLETPCMSNSTSKFALNLVTISINMHLKIHLKNKQTSMANPLKSGPWSHVGKGGLPRWSHLGARWPRGAILHRFCNPFWGSKMSFWRPTML